MLKSQIENSVGMRSEALNIYLCVTQSIEGDIMLNPTEKFKVTILHMNKVKLWFHSGDLSPL